MPGLPRGMSPLWWHDAVEVARVCAEAMQAPDRHPPNLARDRRQNLANSDRSSTESGLTSANIGLDSSTFAPAFSRS